MLARAALRAREFPSRHPALARATAAGAAGSAGVWAYDTWIERGCLINRTARAFWAAAGMTWDYKVMMTYSDMEPGQIHRRVAERWLWCVRRNEGLYTKLAQVVASMNHVLPAEIVEVLSVIQDRAPTVEWAEVERLVAEEFGGKTVDDLFSEFERDAIASASIAQVHRAKLKDGTRVAVKIQKPLVAKQIETDLWAYRTAALAVETFFDLPIMWSVPYTCTQLRTETDFRVEAENSERADALVEPALRPYVSVPRVVHDLSTRRVLTCEWIDGVKVTDAKGIAALGLDSRRVVEIVVRFFAHQLFVTGHLHSDPHPGNILVRKSPKHGREEVVVIDHGLYCDEPERFRLNYASMFKAIVDGDTDTMRRVAREWGIRDHELFASFQILRPYKGRGVTAGTAPVTSGKITKAELLEMQSQAKARVRKMLADSALTPAELSLVGRNLNLVRSVNKALGSPVNRPRILATYANMAVEQHEAKARSALGAAAFETKMWIVEAVFFLTETWRAVVRAVTGRDRGGFEDMLERQVASNVEERFGFKVNLDNNSIG